MSLSAARFSHETQQLIDKTAETKQKKEHEHKSNKVAEIRETLRMLQGCMVFYHAYFFLAL